MSRYLSQPVAQELVAGIDCGDIRPEPGAEKKMADLRRKAEHALALAVRHREGKK